MTRLEGREKRWKCGLFFVLTVIQYFILSFLFWYDKNIEWAFRMHGGCVFEISVSVIGFPWKPTVGIFQEGQSSYNEQFFLRILSWWNSAYIIPLNWDGRPCGSASTSDSCIQRLYQQREASQLKHPPRPKKKQQKKLLPFTFTQKQTSDLNVTHNSKAKRVSPFFRGTWCTFCISQRYS